MDGRRMLQARCLGVVVGENICWTWYREEVVLIQNIVFNCIREWVVGRWSEAAGTMANIATEEDEGAVGFRGCAGKATHMSDAMTRCIFGQRSVI